MSTPRRPHSAEHFGEQRDYWWNADFLALMAARWRLGEVAAALDVGCGVGHWGRLLLPLLAPGARLDGVDPEPAWVEEATARARAAGLGERLRYQGGSAERLPFPDATFDLVTCQTVLIHVADPLAALREMARVARPGGLVAVAEPSNLAATLLLGATRAREGVEQLLDEVRLQLACERGKAALGEGDSSVGPLLPGHLAAAGLEDVRAWQVDKASVLLPPYATREQQVLVADALDRADRALLASDREESRRWFLAGGGGEAEFDRLWAAGLAGARRVARALRVGEEHGLVGGSFFLVSGRRPA